jgi:hypothetical protein
MVIGLPEVLFVDGFVLGFGVIVIPFWQIFKKAGFSPWLSFCPEGGSPPQCGDALLSCVREMA